MIDLHTHSTFSDGSWTPEELVEAAVAAGVTALALTDHDTTAGLPRFLAASAARGIDAVPGVEISAEFNPGSLHVLGYFVPADDPDLERELARFRAGRDARNAEILKRLKELGVPVDSDLLREAAGEGAVGRAHIAEAMVRAKHVKDRRDAFDRFLAKGGPAYVPRDRLAPADAIRLIRDAGGVPVLAHPITLRLSYDRVRELAKELKAYGLAGIEVHYPRHDGPRARRYGVIARELGLIATGGTDHHGAASPDLKLGCGFGGLRVPDAVVADLRAAIPA